MKQFERPKQINKIELLFHFLGLIEFPFIFIVFNRRRKHLANVNFFLKLCGRHYQREKNSHTCI